MSVNNTSVRPLSWAKSLVVEPGDRPMRVPVGLYKGLTLDIDLSSQMQALLSLYERETHSYIRSAATRARWVIDVGAGKGELCAYFLKQTQARVFAMEPLDHVMASLVKTVTRNNLDTSRLTMIGRLAGASEPTSVRLDSLDIDKRQPGFIKIDVDGFEMDVLNSTEGLLDGGSVDFLVEVHSADLERQTIEFLQRHGYKPEIIRNAFWRVILPEQRPIALNRWVWARR